MNLKDMVTSESLQIVLEEMQNEIVALNLPIHATNRIIMFLGTIALLSERQTMERTTILLNLISWFKKEKQKEDESEEIIQLILTLLGGIIGLDDPDKIKTELLKSLGLPTSGKGISKSPEAIYLIQTVASQRQQYNIINEVCTSRLDKLLESFPLIEPTIPRPSNN